MKAFAAVTIIAASLLILAPGPLSQNAESQWELLPPPPPGFPGLPLPLAAVCCYSVTGGDQEDHCEIMDAPKCRFLKGRIVESCDECDIWD